MAKLLVFFFCAALSWAQVYSPRLLREGQPDATDLKSFAHTICVQAHAHTPRERAEAIWRFFLTDGRFVTPGFWYHIAGWTYEEPSGEVLDPIKLLNSYGFGLCYHIAPLLEAIYHAAGFEDARCWFLTGHTVTEVFYDGGYHYFDSDMMGYNVAGDGPFKGKAVASVRDLERHPDIILAKLQTANKVKLGVVDQPWYPADVRAGAMKDLAQLFSTTGDNYLYPDTRYSPGHNMDFVLRSGETLTRFFKPEEPSLYYLPYAFDGKTWHEFPQEIAEYHIRTVDGPRSQKDSRQWATGRLDYVTPKITEAVTVIPMPSPYVIVDARFKLNVSLTPAGNLVLETSVDNGHSWLLAAERHGAYRGEWNVEPKVIASTAHGRLTAVSGTYGYEVRVTKNAGAVVNSMQLTSRVQLNPRTLPFLSPGLNRFTYAAGAPTEREEIAGALTKAKLQDMERIDESGQSLLRPLSQKTGEAIFALSRDDRPLVGFDAGARFLELRNGLAPDKLTAETRHTAVTTSPGSATISWSTSLAGPFREIWRYDSKLRWRDGDAIDRLLQWPEVLKEVRELPAGTKQIYVKFSSAGPAIDNIRLALYSPGHGRTSLKITQIWTEQGQRKRHVETIGAPDVSRTFTVSAGPQVQNEAVIFTSGND